MSDVLSPDEVDALLEGVNNGDIGKANNRFSSEDVSDYDLTATDHISRSDIPSMDLINQEFLRHLKRSIRNLLRHDVEITVGDVVEEKFSDYIATLPEPTMLYLIEIPTLSSHAVFVLSADLLQKYVDIYFGGGAKALESAPREVFTSTELRVSDQLLEISLHDFSLAWESIIPIDAGVLKSESSPKFCKFMESAAPVVVSKFNLQLSPDSEVSLSCVLRGSMLAPLYEKMDASSRGSQSDHRLAWTAALKQRLKDIDLTLSSPIAYKRFSLGKLVRLQAGDVIPIELETKIAVKAGGIELFRGKFGISKNRNSVQIEDIV